MHFATQSREVEKLTINIAVSTFDAIVLGCDSLSSLVQPLINLTKNGGLKQALDANGQPVLDANGQPAFQFPHEMIEQLPTTVFGGVSKMFLLYQTKDTSVAAVTSGQGTINGRTIAALAGMYRRNHELKKTVFRTVEGVAVDFVAFMHQEWASQPNLKHVPKEILRHLPSVNFIVGGYGADDQYGKVFQLDVGQNSASESFAANHHCGVTWGGQSDFVQRLLGGVDRGLEQNVKRRILETLNAQRIQIVEAVLEGLAAQGVNIPPGVNFEIEEMLPPSDPWDRYWAAIDYPNLPVQYAVDLTSLLVNTQSGMQHFGTGIATVGGRTHIGVLQRNEPFKKLKEPKLAHSHTGYSHEL